MFEKEAKERARKIEENQILGVYDNDEEYARDRGWNEGEVAGYEEGFKDGAEFGYNKAFVETENRNCSNCRRSKTGCPNDGSCHNFSLWRPFKNSELTKAKELIGELISSLSVVGECGEEECELLNRAEQFLKDSIE